MNNQATGFETILHRWRWVWAGVVSLLVGLQSGLSYGIGNHNSYLLQGLRMHRPELYANDWLVAHTTSYHSLFNYVAYGLYAIDKSGWSFAIANVLIIALTCLFVFKILALIVDRRYLFAAFLLLMAFVTAGETLSVSGSYIFSNVLQPSSIGALGLVAGLYYFIRGSYLTSGIVVALAGVFHLNFLILAVPLFTLAHILSGKDNLLGRLIRQLGPMVLAVVPFLPTLFDAGIAENAAEGRRIFQQIQAPQHYLPLTYLQHFSGFVGWHLVGILAGWRLLFGNDVSARLRACLIALLSLVAVATLLTTVVFVPAVSQMYFWRLAPYSVLLAQLIGCAGVVKLLIERDWPIRLWQAGVAVVVAYFCIEGVSAFMYGHHRTLSVNMLIAVSVAVIVASATSYFVAQKVARKQVVTYLCAIVFWIWATAGGFGSFVAKSSLVAGLPEDESALYQWARDSTEVDDLFLVPPLLQNFRFNAQRAIVVDWKSCPVMPDEIVIWYQRIEMVTGIEGIGQRKDADEGYAAMDNRRLTDLFGRYGFDYVVVPKERGQSAFREYESVYSNPSFTVMRRKA